MNTRMWITVCCGFLMAAETLAAEPEKEFKLSDLQQRVADAHKKWVIPDDDRLPNERHLILLKTLVFDGQKDVRRQIRSYENKNRKGYEDGPFYVRELTGKRGQASAWEAWYKEAFTIEQKWAEGLEIPYFCQVLRLRDKEGRTVLFGDVDVAERGELSRKAVRAILEPLASGADREIGHVPLFVVSYTGNFEGNAKYVKLYIGKPESAEFLVLDVSVYDHY